MFDVKKSGKNGDWYVYFITIEGQIKIISFHNEEYEAVEKANYMNILVKKFIEEILTIDCL